MVSTVWDPGRNWKVRRTAKTQANTPAEQRNDKGTKRQYRASKRRIDGDDDSPKTEEHRRTPIAKNKKRRLPARYSLTPGRFFDRSRTIIERVL